MTVPDSSPVDQALAAYEAAVAAAEQNDAAALVQAQQDLAAAQQQHATDQAALATDAAQHAADQSTMAGQALQIAQLQAQLAAATAHVLYGSALGGWFSTENETEASSHPRIKAGFGGRLPSVRSFSGTGVPLANEIDDTCRLYLVELSYNLSDAQLDAAFKAALPNTVLTPAHEPENPSKGIKPAAYQAYIKRVGAAKIRSGRTDVKVALVFMYDTYGSRSNWISGNVPWSQWIPNPLPPGIDAIGADVYPSYGAGTAKPASPDTPQILLDPCVAAAKALGVPLHIPEFGCGKNTWADADRAAFTKATFDYCDAIAGTGPGQIASLQIFECDDGSGGPWCVLPRPNPATQGAWNWPLTLAVITARMGAVPAA
jgi:hypothetical protein